jgi:hypothetical protein
MAACLNHGFDQYNRRNRDFLTASRKFGIVTAGELLQGIFFAETKLVAATAYGSSHNGHHVCRHTGIQAGVNETTSCSGL